MWVFLRTLPIFKKYRLHKNKLKMFFIHFCVLELDLRTIGWTAYNFKKCAVIKTDIIGIDLTSSTIFNIS